MVQKKGGEWIVEIWKDIDGYDGKYQVSNWGKVKNTETGNVLTPYLNKKGYEKVDLYHGRTRRKFRVNRLVAMTFIPNVDNLPQVNHKDGNKLNNSVTNLEWTDNSGNMKHYWRMRRGMVAI